MADLDARPGSCGEQPPRGSTGRTLRPRAANARDLPAIRTLVAGDGLPLEGVDEALVLATAVLGGGENLLGTASVEVHGRVGLLRSVVVSPGARGCGLGRALVANRIEWARAIGLEQLVLFTETAPDFFERLGFERVSRAELPVEVHGAFEFGFCPESSHAMRLTLARSTRERIRARYAAAARRSPAPSDATSRSETSCCGGAYAEAELADIAPAVRASSLGCGNPAAVARLREGEIVLDLGSGGGLDVLLAARRVGSRGRVYGLDASEGMLALAEEHRAASGVDNVRFLRGHLESIPLPDAHVDVVISNCVVNLSPDRRAAFAEAFRVLRPGGRLAIADVIAHEHASGAPRVAAEEAIGCLAGTLRRSELLALLEEIGFADVVLEESFTYREEHLASSIADPALARVAGGQLMSAIVRATRPEPEGVTP